MQRNVIYHPHGRGFHPALERELERRGVRFRKLDDIPDGAPLSDGLACSIWFYQPLRHPLSTWTLKRRLARDGVPLVAWNRDAPHYLNRSSRRLDLLDRARILDVYATHTLVDTKRSFADLVLYLPNAADVERYNPGPDATAALARLRQPDGYRWDVTFFGGMNGKRYKEDRQRQEFFAALGAKLDARGITHHFREAEGMTVEDQIAFIHASRINLNFGARCEYGAAVASGLPERCYGIPACGGFLLCDRRLHARDDFAVGDNWAEFDGLDDCVAQIEYWLAHFDAARDLAERCHRHVMARHTYAHRAATLHDALLRWHRGERGLCK
jgi:spore maturation protein CgeB